MNIFFIPSWYPSGSHPLPGIFFRDQALALARHYPELKIGISIWGQNDERMLLWARRPARSFGKVLTKSRYRSGVDSIATNVVEFHTPTFTWTDKLFDGNLNQIIRANDHNLRKFELEHGKVAIIHAHVGYPAGYIAKKLSEIHGIPYIITEQMSPFPHEQFSDSTGKTAKRLKTAYEFSAANIAISDTLARDMVEWGVKNLTVIPNLVDDVFFSVPIIPLRNEKFKFFSMGRLVPQKGIDVLLHAFAKLKSGSVLRIGGNGETISEYQHLAAQLGIGEKVLWLGELTREQAAIEFQQCDAFVLPSRHESMGLVFAEAMACGRPVIATHCGGPEEFIDDNTGIVIEKEDIDKLVLAMETMITKAGSYSAQQIRESCRTRFSSGTICNKIMDQYCRVVTGGHE
jgi:glycosyltransferase involved in cell wall biosynthesis